MGPRSDYYTKALLDSLIGGWAQPAQSQICNQAYVDAGDVNRRKYTVMSETELKAAGGNWSAPQCMDYEGYFQSASMEHSAHKPLLPMAQFPN